MSADNKQQNLNQSEGPWAREKREPNGSSERPDPWGANRRGTSQGNGANGDLDRVVALGRERLRRLGGSGNGGGQGSSGRGGSGGGFSPTLIVGVTLVVLLGLWLTQAIKINNPGEVGLVSTFGSFYQRNAEGEIVGQGRIDGQGIHPIFWPFQSYQRLSVDRLNEATIGFTRDSRSGNRIRVQDESDMLTSDRNIISIQLTVQWRIDNLNPDQFIFSAVQPEAVLDDAAESVIRGLMAQTPFEQALDEGRLALQDAARTELETLINERYRLGIRIENVLIEEARPPQDTLEAFNAVSASEAIQGRLQEEAERERARLLFQARADAEQVVRAAEGYRASAVLEAIGQADRFLSVYNAFIRQPQAFSERQVLEALEDVLGSGENVILESDSVLPYLPLPTPNGSSGAPIVAPGAAPTLQAN